MPTPSPQPLLTPVPSDPQQQSQANAAQEQVKDGPPGRSHEWLIRLPPVEIQRERKCPKISRLRGVFSSHPSAAKVDSSRSVPAPPSHISSCFILDVVGTKMFEELKSRLDTLAQEVALLKEQQALQTGECRQWPLWAGVPERRAQANSQQCASHLWSGSGSWLH